MADLSLPLQKTTKGFNVVCVWGGGGGMRDWYITYNFEVHLLNTHTDIHTGTTDTNTHPYTHIHRYTHASIDTHTQPHTHTYNTHADEKQTIKHASTHTGSPRWGVGIHPTTTPHRAAGCHTHTHTHTHKRAHTHTHTHTHTHKRTQTQGLTRRQQAWCGEVSAAELYYD